MAITSLVYSISTERIGICISLENRLWIVSKSFRNRAILEFDDSHPRGEASHNSPLFTRILIASKVGVYARTRDHIMFEIT